MQAVIVRKINKSREGRIMLSVSKNKGDGTRSYWLSRWTFVLSFFVSVGLIVGGFLTPPIGIIDGSVLTAIGEILLFPTLLYAFRALELGYKIKVQKGDATIEVHKKE